MEDRFPHDVVSRMWERTLSVQRGFVQARPRYAPGLNLILRYMEWDMALYRAAREEGITASDAGRLIEDVNWAIFGPATKISFTMSRLRSTDLIVRVRWIVDLMFKMLFTTPFRRNTYPSTSEVAFDVTACPLAEYFNEHGAPELTSFAACSLDYGMASVWGVTLHRTQTIAGGHPLCDFRFRLGTGDVAQPVVQANGPTFGGSAP